MLKRFQAYRLAVESNIMQIDEVRYREDLPKLGLDFIKLGLQDVLYDPKTKQKGSRLVFSLLPFFSFLALDFSRLSNSLIKFHQGSFTEGIILVKSENFGVDIIGECNLEGRGRKVKVHNLALLVIPKYNPIFWMGRKGKIHVGLCILCKGWLSRHTNGYGRLVVGYRIVC